MATLHAAAICGGFVLYIQLLAKVTDWLCCQPWWDRVRPALIVAEVALGGTVLAVALLGGSLTAEAVGVSCALVGFVAVAFTAVERTV